MNINSSLDFILKYIGNNKLREIDSYVLKVLAEKIYCFNSMEDVSSFLMPIYDKFIIDTSISEKEQILRYTGLDFRRVNQILRGYWDYEKNGKLTPEIKEEATNLADSLRNILFKAPSVPFNIMTYRGVGIAAFYSYGITSIKDLGSLKDKYFFESGFTSTSLLPDSSFYVKQPEWGDNCNIEIECIVPTGSDEGVLLMDSSISHSPYQHEFLINSSSLFKIVDVLIDENNNKAKIKFVLIPEKMWNPLDYEVERSRLGLN